MKIKQSTEELLSYFLTESEDKKSPEELVELYRIKREPLISGLLNFRKKQQSEASWRKNRWGYMRGIKRFHKSFAGKKFHRALGRFLSQKILRPKLTISSMLFPDHKDTMLHSRTLVKESYDQYAILTALSSLKTHMYIERNYCHPMISESVEVASLLEYAIPLLNALEQKIFCEAYTEITEDELELLLRLVDRTTLLKECADILSVSYDECKTQYIHLFEEQKKTTDPSEEHFLINIFQLLS